MMYIDANPVRGMQTRWKGWFLRKGENKGYMHKDQITREMVRGDVTSMKLYECSILGGC